MPIDRVALLRGLATRLEFAGLTIVGKKIPKKELDFGKIFLRFGHQLTVYPNSDVQFYGPNPEAFEDLFPPDCPLNCIISAAIQRAILLNRKLREKQLRRLTNDTQPSQRGKSNSNASTRKRVHQRHVRPPDQIGAEPPKPRRTRTGRGGVATLERRLSGCERTIVAFFDAVAPYWVPRARRLAEAGDDPNKALAELALRVRKRASDQGETCSPLQLSSSEAELISAREWTLKSTISTTNAGARVRQ